MYVAIIYYRILRQPLTSTSRTTTTSFLPFFFRQLISFLFISHFIILSSIKSPFPFLHFSFSFLFFSFTFVSLLFISFLFFSFNFVSFLFISLLSLSCLFFSFLFFSFRVFSFHFSSFPFVPFLFFSFLFFLLNNSNFYEISKFAISLY